MSRAAHEEKQALRGRARAARSALSLAERRSAAERLAEHLPHHPLIEQVTPGQVLVPVGHRSEIGTGPLAARLHRLGWSIVRPRSVPDRSHIDAVPWPLDAPLFPGFAGIPEPPADAPPVAPEALRLILVPALLFAADGHRLGSGMGFFDRFLAPLVGLPDRPVTLGIGYALQRVDAVPHEAHDIPLDGLQLEDTSIVCRTR